MEDIYISGKKPKDNKPEPEDIYITPRNRRRETPVYEMYEEPIDEAVQGKIDHISFVSNDIEADYAYCQKQGYTICTDGIEGIPTFWEKGCRYFKLLTPTGEQVEFCQIL